MLDYYHLYLNHPGGSRLANKSLEVSYWKYLVTKEDLYAKPCKICQQFKKRNTLYGNLPPKNIAELKLWDLVHVDLIGPYSKSISQKQVGIDSIQNNFSMDCMPMIGPATV